MKLQTMDIAVIGAGIGGLAMALYLHKNGHKITIYEQADHAEPVGAGFLLQPPGQMVLDDLGVLDGILKDAVPITKLQSITKSGKHLLDLDYTKLAGASRTGLGVQRSTIFYALYDQAKLLDITFKWGACIQDIQSCDTAAILTIDDQAIQHDLCIISSGTRADHGDALFPSRKKTPYEWGCLWTTIDLPNGFCPNTLHQRCHSAKQMMGILPTLKSKDGHKAALYWSVKQSQVDALTNTEFNLMKNQMIELWPDSQPSIHSIQLSDMKTAIYYDIWTPHPYNGLVITIGDYCHATSPQLGQGCTMALLDAYTLNLALSNRTGAPDKALKLWWKSRKKQLRYVRYMSRFLTPLYQSDHKLYGWFRDYIMAPIGKMPGFYGLQLRTLASDIFNKNEN